MKILHRRAAPSPTEEPPLKRSDVLIGAWRWAQHGAMFLAFLFAVFSYVAGIHGSRTGFGFDVLCAVLAFGLWDQCRVIRRLIRYVRWQQMHVEALRTIVKSHTDLEV